MNNKLYFCLKMREDRKQELAAPPRARNNFIPVFGGFPGDANHHRDNDFAKG